MLSKYLHFICKAAAIMLLPLLAWSCQWMKEDYDDYDIVDSSAAQYINITISVSTGNNPVTRANPTGGEYGDGPETGINNENEVNDITLIFYQDDAGINTTSNDAKVVCVKKYNVHPYTDNYYPIGHDHKPGEPYNVQAGEVLYTTGEQKLEETSLQAGQTYKVIVVANAPEDFSVSVDETIKSVRDKTLTTVYHQGNGIGTNAGEFVMTSESDATISLVNPTVYTSTTVAEDNRYVYYFSCIHVERMAARIDFWTKNSNGYKTSTDNADYTTAGYEYTVKKTDGTDSQDRFILTSITPFNLNNGDEYMLKRVTTGFGEGAVTTWLGNESFANYVLDPYTTTKTSTPNYAMASTLTSVTTNISNTYNVTMASQHPADPQQSPIINVEGNDDIILCYAKENTLKPGSPLYYHATGLAFEGYYYRKGKGTGERMVFYHYIRHQGENDNAYNALRPDELNTETPCPASTAMNYGIVRNNIYRISVNQVTANGGIIVLNIAVHDWRNVQHPEIYI